MGILAKVIGEKMGSLRMELYQRSPFHTKQRHWHKVKPLFFPGHTKWFPQLLPLKNLDSPYKIGHPTILVLLGHPTLSVLLDNKE